MIGLEAQLLGIVVRKERPELEEQKDALVINIAANKKKLEELEDEILRLTVSKTRAILSEFTEATNLVNSQVMKERENLH